MNLTVATLNTTSMPTVVNQVVPVANETETDIKFNFDVFCCDPDDDKVK